MGNFQTTCVENLLRIVGEIHDGSGQKYCDFPYSLHLKWVRKTAHRFSHLLDKSLHFEMECTAVLHDSCEDTYLNYADIKSLLQDCNVLGDKLRTRIADNVLALTTDPRGKTRKERHSVHYYRNMMGFPIARFVKIADRIANMEYGKLFYGSMFKKYQSEMPDFLEWLEVKEFPEMEACLLELGEFRS